MMDNIIIIASISKIFSVVEDNADTDLTEALHSSNFKIGLVFLSSYTTKVLYVSLCLFLEMYIGYQ